MALALGLIVGCGGSKTVTVSGKLVPPAKLKIADTDSINVFFVPEDATSGKSTALSVNAKDLTFSGPVVPGKYKIGVTVEPYAGMKDSEARTQQISQIMGGFNSGATPLRFEVTKDSTQSITVDLAKSSVSK